jgi:hypothetical protein
MHYCLQVVFLILLQYHATANPQLPNGNFGKAISDHFGASVNIGKAIANSIPDIVPSLNELLDFGKQKIAGLPFKLAASAIHRICECLNY